MRFSLTNDQIAFRDAVCDLLAKECPPAVVRSAWDAPAGQADRGVWDSLDAMGVLGLLVPEADGGLGLDETFLVPILEEAGRVALPHPLIETAMVAAPLLGGDRGLVTTDLGGPVIAWAADADVVLVHRGGALLAIDRHADLMAAPIVPVETVDRARRAGRLLGPDQWGDEGPPDRTTRTVGVASAAPELIEEPGVAPELVTDDPAVIELAFDRGALGTAAALIGLAQTMLDMTVAYVTDRHQFGRPIGSFQAVKHHLADAALALEMARPAVWRAAWSVAHDEPTRSRDVSMAKAMSSEAAELVGRQALQCHGAIGYTVEADLHLYLKRSWALARAWGDSAFHTDRVAQAIGA